MNQPMRHKLRAVTIGLMMLIAAAPTPAPAAAPTPEAGLTREQRIQWWREARFGMLVCWGLYAIPAGVWKENVYSTGYAEWVMF